MPRAPVLILALATTLCGCASIFAPPDWKFDCEWARFRDFQEAAQGRISRGSWTRMFCDVDPSSLEYWSARRPPPAEEKK